jgi:hypothetical protein
LGIYLSDAEVIYFSDSRPVTPVSWSVQWINSASWSVSPSI